MSVRPSNSKSSRITRIGSTSNKNITNNKITKKIEKNTNIKPKGENPAWFNVAAKKEEMSAEEIKELEDLLKEYR